MKKSIFLLTVFSFLVIMITGCKEDDFLKNDNDETLLQKSYVALVAGHVPMDVGVVEYP